MPGAGRIISRDEEPERHDGGHCHRHQVTLDQFLWHSKTPSACGNVYNRRDMTER